MVRVDISVVKDQIKYLIDVTIVHPGAACILLEVQRAAMYSNNFANSFTTKLKFDHHHQLQTLKDTSRTKIIPFSIETPG